MKQFFTDSNGKLSHKRLISSAAFVVVSLVMANQAVKQDDLGVEWVYAYTAFVSAVGLGNASEAWFKKAGGDA